MNNHDRAYLEKFGENLRKIREDRGYTQSYLADIANIPRSQIVRIEKGEINTTIITLRTLANKLGIEAHELFVL